MLKQFKNNSSIGDIGYYLDGYVWLSTTQSIWHYSSYSCILSERKLMAWHYDHFYFMHCIHQNIF